MFVQMDKQVGREEKKHIDDDEYYINNMEYKEIQDPSAKRVIVHDFGKQVPRYNEDLREELGIAQDELIIEANPLPKQVKGAVAMAKAGERFPEKLPNKDPFYDEQPISDLTLDVNKAIKATKP